MELPQEEGSKQSAVHVQRPLGWETGLLEEAGAGRKKGRVILVIVELFCNGSNFLSIPLLFNFMMLEMPEQKAM